MENAKITKNLLLKNKFEYFSDIQLYKREFCQEDARNLFSCTISLIVDLNQKIISLEIRKGSLRSYSKNFDEFSVTRLDVATRLFFNESISIPDEVTLEKGMVVFDINDPSKFLLIVKIFEDDTMEVFDLQDKLCKTILNCNLKVNTENILDIFNTEE